MPDSTLALLTAKTPGAAALLYGAVSPYTPGLDRKVSMTAAGAQMLEAADVAAQITLLNAATLGANTFTGAQTIPVGSASATSLHFGTAGTGVYSAAAATEVDVAIAGTKRLALTAGSLRFDSASSGDAAQGFIITGSGGQTATLSAQWTSGLSCTTVIGSRHDSVNTVRFGAWNSNTLTNYFSLCDDNVAHTLALKSATNAQTMRIYGTYTDASNYTRLSLAATSTTMTIACETLGTGADDIDLTLTPAGTGCVKFGTHAALAGETVTGYITVKDSGGTARKLAVVS